MRDAIDMAQGYLAEHGTRDRKVLLVITDGIDNANTVTRDRIEKQAEQRDTVIFAVGLFGDEERVKQGRNELDQLADKTGGLAYYPFGIDEIGSVVLEIARQIRNQYTIAYAPSNQKLDGTYRTIRLTVNSPETLTVRARAGYRATPSNFPSKQFRGDLEATSKGQMLTAGTDVNGSAGYVAMEWVIGTLHAHSGTFALQHSGTMVRGAPQLTVTVVPDSGTGQLVGLAGTMTINIVDGKHVYDSEYTLAKPR